MSGFVTERTISMDGFKGTVWGQLPDFDGEFSSAVKADAVSVLDYSQEKVVVGLSNGMKPPTQT